MRLGLQIVSFDWPGGPVHIGPTLAAIARAADEAGFASIWVMDHFFQIPGAGQVEGSMLESYTTLSYLAGATKRVRLGALVTGVVYRHPGILVKTVSTLDVVSGGRAYLGIGAAWNERETC
jgi:alkanesulfonate monooxygenase SsuD/methylene tetrahydromethanopterin reductase-like flavin-dependent oxidoreductase (luciferase family)